MAKTTPQATPPRETVKARPNVYTMLAFAAFAIIAFGVGFVGYQNVAMTQEIQREADPTSGGQNPFYIIPEDQQP